LMRFREKTGSAKEKARHLHSVGLILNPANFAISCSGAALVSESFYPLINARSM
jgi:hypothetical protein